MSSEHILLRQYLTSERWSFTISLPIKAATCPVRAFEGGSRPEDCACVEATLFEIGQKLGPIQYEKAPAKSGMGTSAGRRDIAIGMLRLNAFVHCGFFNPDHPVSQNFEPSPKPYRSFTINSCSDSVATYCTYAKEA